MYKNQEKEGLLDGKPVKRPYYELLSLMKKEKDVKNGGDFEKLKNGDYGRSHSSSVKNEKLNEKKEK